MCLILVSKKGQELKKDWLEVSFASNSHGSGFMYSKNKELIIRKGFFKFEEFHEEYLKECVGLPHVIHHRFATSGDKNKENCHPFIFLNGDEEENKNKYRVAFAHNGVITGFGYKIKDKSDTFSFCETIFKPITKDCEYKKWWVEESFQWWVQNAIGRNNKLAVMDNEGDIAIFNESSGHWIGPKEDGIWASNDQYKFPKTRYNPNTPGTCDSDFESHYMNHYQATKKLREEKEEEIANSSHYPKHQKGKPKSIVPFVTPNTSFSKPVPITSIDFFGLPPETLKEIDDYLALINKDNPATA